MHTTKIGTEVAHVTRDSDTTFKVKSQWSRSPGRFAHRRVGESGGYSAGRGNVLAVGNCCYVGVCSAMQGASAPTEGEGRGHTVAADRLQLVYLPSQHLILGNLLLLNLLGLMWVRGLAYQVQSLLVNITDSVCCVVTGSCRPFQRSARLHCEFRDDVLGK